LTIGRIVVQFVEELKLASHAHLPVARACRLRADDLNS